MSNRKLSSASSDDIDQRMFICDTCGEKFWIKSKLDKHILSHAETVFTCYSCEESFTSYSELDLHSRSHTRYDQSNECPHCTTKFENRSELLFHMHITHPEHSTEVGNKPQLTDLEKNVSSASAIFKNESQAKTFPKIVQVGTLSGNSKVDRNLITFGAIHNLQSPAKSNDSSPRIKSILKSSDAVTYKKINKPINWENPVNVDSILQPSETPVVVKRISDFSQASPRKQLKVDHSAKVKQGTVGNYAIIRPVAAQNQTLRLLKSSPKSNDFSSSTKHQMPSTTTAVKRIAETSFSPITGQNNGTVKKQVRNLMPSATTVKRVGETSFSPLAGKNNATVKKQVTNPVKTVSYSTLPKQPIPSKGMMVTVADVHNAPDKKLGKKENPSISTNQLKMKSSRKIVINLPQQGGLIQPGQQLVSADLFAGKTFIIQKSPNSKGSDNKAGSESQFLKQRVLINPVPSPKPPVQSAAVQPVVLASPVKILLTPTKTLMENSTILKNIGAQKTDFKSSVDSKLPQNYSSKTSKENFKKSTQTKRVSLHKAESPHDYPEKVSICVVTPLPQNPPASLLSAASPSTRGGKRYSPKKIGSANVGINEKTVCKLIQAKIKFPPKNVNSIDLGNLTSLKVVLPTISLKKLPDSIYEECVKNGFISMQNLRKRFLAASKIAQKMRSKNTVEDNMISTDNKTRNLKACISNVAMKENVLLPPRSTKNTITEDAHIEIPNVSALGNTEAQNLNDGQNFSSSNVQEMNKDSNKQNVNIESMISRITRNTKKTLQGLSNQQSRNMEAEKLNLDNDGNISTPVLKKTKKSINVTVPVSTDKKISKRFLPENKTEVSPTKRYPKRGVNAKMVNQIMSTGQVLNMKTCDDTSLQNIKNSDMVSAPSVKTNELNSSPKGIADPSGLSVDISPSAKVQITKAAKNVKKNNVSSPVPANNALKSTPTKKYPKRGVNAAKIINQISSTSQVQNEKTCKNAPLKSIKTSDIVSAEKVKASRLCSTPKDITNSLSITNITPIPSQPSAKVQIMKAGENVNKNELRSVKNTIASSPPKSTPSNVKVVPVSADFMKKLKESLLKTTPGADSNSIRLVVPSEVLSKIQVPASESVSNTNITTDPKHATPSVNTNAGVLAPKMGSNIQISGAQTVSNSNITIGAKHATPSVNINKSVVLSKVANNIQVTSEETVAKARITTGPERATPFVDTNVGAVLSKAMSNVQAPGILTPITTGPKTVALSATTPVTVPFRRPRERFVKNYENVDDLLEEDRKKREEKEMVKKKEKILKKMLKKYEEKEEKKQVKYFQKKLSRFIEKNQEHLLGSVEKLNHVISNSSRILEEIRGLKHANETEIMNKLVTNVMLESLINDYSSGKSVDNAEQQKMPVQSFINVSERRAQKKDDSDSTSLKRNTDSLKQMAVSSNPKSKSIFSSALGRDSIYVYDAANETSVEDKADQASYSKFNNSTKKTLRKRSQKQVMKPFQEDPFTDLSIITGETFTIECPCQKENCDGLHPEMTFF